MPWEPRQKPVRVPTERYRVPVFDTRRVKAEPPPERPVDRPFASFYGSPEWKKLVNRIIRERGRRCEDPNCRNPNISKAERIYGDHVHELKDGGSKLDPNGILLRCASCHTLKSQAVSRARKAGLPPPPEATALPSRPTPKKATDFIIA